MKRLAALAAVLLLAGCGSLLNPARFLGPVVADPANNWRIHRATPCSEPEILAGPRAGWVRREFCTDAASIKVYFPVGLAGASRRLLTEEAVAASAGHRYYIDGLHVDIAGHLAHVAADFHKEGK